MAENPVQNALDKLWQTHRTIQDKYVFFLMVAAGVSIAYLLNNGPGNDYPWQIYIFFGSLIFLSISFLSGCYFINFLLKFLFANMNFLNTHEMDKRDDADRKMKGFNKKTIIFWRLQFQSIIIAYLFFLPG
jgi:hypothetical protein